MTGVLSAVFVVLSRVIVRRYAFSYSNAHDSKTFHPPRSAGALAALGPGFHIFNF